MLAVVSKLPDAPTPHPPVILVHGAANSACVWTLWQQELAARGWASHAIDLRGHGRSDTIDLSQTSMNDYAADIRSLADQLVQPPVLMGWSMGGLVAIMVAAEGNSSACVALAPSMPARRVDTTVELRTGEFGADEYGIVSKQPGDQLAMADLDLQEQTIALSSLGQESRLARGERKAGIVVEQLSCPLLIVTGSEDRAWPSDRYHDLWLDTDYLQVEGASHWGLVLNRRALDVMVPEITGWLSKR